MTASDFNIDFPVEIITEGQEKFLVPRLKAYMKSASDYAPSKAPVFYNPVMELSRDIATLVLKVYQGMVGHEISACEPLAGCGIRGVRFAAEVKGTKKVVMSDISKKACQIARYNVKLNKLERKIVVKNEDANLLLSKNSAPHKRFDVVDVDPFGSPVPYMDSAVRALRNHGLLALTATDMAPLCGVHPRACVRKYGGKPLRAEYCQELAVRLLTGCLATLAAKHEMGIHVVLSHNASHYIRVYSIMEYGAKKADESLKNMGYMLHCFNCFHRETVLGLSALGIADKCSECGSRLSVGGPSWLGRLFDRSFCERMADELEHEKLGQKGRIAKMLALTRDEVDTTVGYYVIDKLCDAWNLPVPSVRSVIGSLRKDGFQASLTRFTPKGVRTDASAAKMKALLEEMVKGSQ